MVVFVLKMLRKLTKVSPKVVNIFMYQKMRNILKPMKKLFSVFYFLRYGRSLTLIIDQKCQFFVPKVAQYSETNAELNSKFWDLNIPTNWEKKHLHFKQLNNFCSIPVA